MDYQTVEITNNRILIVDDNESIHEDFKKILLEEEDREEEELSILGKKLFSEQEEKKKKEEITKVNYEIHNAYQGEEAIQKVKDAEKLNKPYALIFMDVRMPPGINGIEAISRIWQIDPYIEMVICTAYSDYSWDDIIQKVGQTDKLLFLKKPFYSVEVKQIALSMVIKRNLNDKIRNLISQLESEVKKRTEQLQTLLEELKKTNFELLEKNRLLADISERDGLTGLYNRVAMYVRLEEILEEASRHHFPVSLIIMDIDNFNNINESFGHIAGDEVLVEIAELLKSEIRIKTQEKRKEDAQKGVLRKYDVTARYGEDEFAIVLPYCGYEEACKVTERIYTLVKGMKIKKCPEININLSIGTSVLKEDGKCKEPEKLIVSAEKVLEKIKKEGGDKYKVEVFR